MRECQNCFRKPEDTPMIYRSDPWCSDNCRKIIVGEIVLGEEPILKISSL